MPYWCAQLEPQRERLTLHVLGLSGYECYLPRLREHRIVRHSRVETAPPLFPGYCFITATLQWHVADNSPGVRSLIRDGDRPACIADAIIAAIRARERNGLVELPKPPPRFRRGDRVHVVQGPFVHRLGIFEGMRPRERCEVLLAFLGSTQRMILPAAAIERVRPWYCACRTKTWGFTGRRSAGCRLLSGRCSPRGWPRSASALRSRCGRHQPSRSCGDCRATSSRSKSVLNNLGGRGANRRRLVFKRPCSLGKTLG